MRSFGNLLVERMHRQGFIVLGHFERMAEARVELAGWMVRVAE